MTLDEIVKSVFGSLLAALLAAVAWAGKAVLDSRARIGALEVKVESLEKDKITKDDIREIMEDALEKRDKHASERRAEWDRLFTLEVKQAVAEGQEKTKTELERMVPRIVKEVLDKTGRHNRPSGMGAVDA